MKPDLETDTGARFPPNYAHGLSTRDIQAQILDWYGVEVSPTLISNVTEAVMDEVRQWQNRALETLYPILYMDCLQLKVRENQRIISKAVYLALGVTMEGHKELLGMWMSESEGAKFWLAVCTQLRNRGMKDCYIACVDGLTGAPCGYRNHFPTDPGSTVYGPYGAQCAQICQLQAASRGGA